MDRISLVTISIIILIIVFLLPKLTKRRQKTPFDKNTEDAIIEAVTRGNFEVKDGNRILIDANEPDSQSHKNKLTPSFIPISSYPASEIPRVVLIRFYELIQTSGIEQYWETNDVEHTKALLESLDKYNLSDAKNTYLECINSVWGSIEKFPTSLSDYKKRKEYIQENWEIITEKLEGKKRKILDYIGYEFIDNLADELETQREAYVDELEQLGYFKYTPENSLEHQKDELKDLYRKNSFFFWPIPASDESKYPSWDSFDKRFYFGDPENIAEGDLTKIIISMKEFLELEGVKIDQIKDDLNETQGVSWHVFIDDKKITIYEKYEDQGQNLWKYCTYKLLSIINELLTEAGSNERLYILEGGEGPLVFLNEELYRYAKSILPNIPLESEKDLNPN